MQCFNFDPEKVLQKLNKQLIKTNTTVICCITVIVPVLWETFCIVHTTLQNTNMLVFKLLSILKHCFQILKHCTTPIATTEKKLYEMSLRIQYFLKSFII